MVEQSSGRENGTTETNQPEQPSKETTESWRFLRWFGKIFRDPNACMTMLATVVIALFTFVLAWQGRMQQKILVATAQPVITTNIATLGKDISGKWLVSFPAKNSGKWTARYVGFDGGAILTGHKFSGEILPQYFASHCLPASEDALPMGPQDGYQFDAPWSGTFINDALIEKLRQGELTLVLVGCIGYRDELGNAYKTPVCQEFVPDGKDGGFAFCTLHNPVVKNAPTPESALVPEARGTENVPLR